MKFNQWRCALPLAVFLAAIWFQSCGSRDKSGEEELTGELAAGRDAAQKHCGTCHLPVAPALLDKDTWKNRVLPVMAQYFAIEVWQKNQYFASEQSAMPIAEWMNIVAYYDSLAPVQLQAVTPPAGLREDWAGFSMKAPARDTARLATTTMVAIDSAARAIYTSSSEVPSLVKWNAALQKERTMPLSSPAMHMRFEGEPIATVVGEMRAYDVSKGELYRLGREANAAPKVFANSLRRPLHTSEADFDRDGKTEYVVSAFGHNQGGLYLLRPMPDGQYVSKPLREAAGATQSVTGDFNGDGWTDIVALFAHAQEGIWLFTNDRKGGFTEKALLRFPPVYGSSSFQLTDFNGDGQLDILYTSGDNSDYSRILKPYHGIYIFLNKGKFEFEQSFFYPQNGATKAIAADFDGDGDADIASVAFFADLRGKPAEKFLILRNASGSKGQALKFESFAPPIARYGRWICMDVNDIDGDGDPDIVLGNYSKGFLNQEDVRADWDVYLPFIVLENGRGGKPAAVSALAKKP